MKQVQRTTLTKSKRTAGLHRHAVHRLNLFDISANNFTQDAVDPESSPELKYALDSRKAAAFRRETPQLRVCHRLANVLLHTDVFRQHTSDAVFAQSLSILSLNEWDQYSTARPDQHALIDVVDDSYYFARYGQHQVKHSSVVNFTRLYIELFSWFREDKHRFELSLAENRQVLESLDTLYKSAGLAQVWSDAAIGYATRHLQFLLPDLASVEIHWKLSDFRLQSSLVNAHASQERLPFIPFMGEEDITANEKSRPKNTAHLMSLRHWNKGRIFQFLQRSTIAQIRLVEVTALSDLYSLDRRLRHMERHANSELLERIWDWQDCLTRDFRSGFTSRLDMGSGDPYDPVTVPETTNHDSWLKEALCFDDHDAQPNMRTSTWNFQLQLSCVSDRGLGDGASTDALYMCWGHVWDLIKNGTPTH